MSSASIGDQLRLARLTRLAQVADSFEWHETVMLGHGKTPGGKDRLPTKWNRRSLAIHGSGGAVNATVQIRRVRFLGSPSLQMD